jgi:hypothetical protein
MGVPVAEIGGDATGLLIDSIYFELLELIVGLERECGTSRAVTAEDRVRNDRGLSREVAHEYTARLQRRV